MLVLLKSAAEAIGGDWMYGLFRPDCYQKYFHDLNFMDVVCLKLLLSKLLGYGIITGSLIVKLPQIIKLLQSGRADNIAPSMFILENIGYTISSVYNYRHGYAFSTYGESVFLLLQGFILVFLVFKYNNRLNASFFSVSAVYFAFAYAILTVVPLTTLATLQSLTIPLFAASRLPQIYTNYVMKSTGQLAFLTTLLNAAGSLARVFTTIEEVDDRLMLIGVSISTLLNGIIFIQMLLYWNSPTNKEIKSATKTSSPSTTSTSTTTSTNSNAKTPTLKKGEEQTKRKKPALG